MNYEYCHRCFVVSIIFFFTVLKHFLKRFDVSHVIVLDPECSKQCIGFTLPSNFYYYILLRKYVPVKGLLERFHVTIFTFKNRYF